MWACTYGIDRWTPAKLVVVNLVKFHLTKLKWDTNTVELPLNMYNTGTFHSMPYLFLFFAR